jgi:murein DD-endopeptidase MepM/ murein hydrolase activator NlpD
MGRWVPLLFLSVLSGIAAAASARAEDQLTISSAPRQAQPGDVILIEVATLEPPLRVAARVFGRELAFYPDADRKRWRGLIGVDLERRPGEYVLTVESIREGRASLTATHQLRVTDKQFPTRRVRVAAQFVTPPPSALERIAREAKGLRAIFDTVTARRWDGPFLKPVDDRPANNFGSRSIFNGQPRTPHAGIDFMSREGTPVRSPNAGQIVLAQDLFFTGNTVIVDHGLGLYSLFAHLSRIDVEPGQVVEPEATLGLVGATGRVSGPHLHWAVRLGGARVDPLSLIAALEIPGTTTADQR